MRKISVYVWMILTLICLAPSVQGQILNRVLDKTMNKVNNALEEKASDLIADLLARQLEKQIDHYWEELTREAVRQDSIDRAQQGDTSSVDPSEAVSRYLANMNRVSDVPEEYVFNWKFDCLMGTGKEEDESVFYYSDDQPFFGIEQEDKGDVNLIVIDLGKNIMVMFKEDKKGEKTAQALPNMMNYAGKVAEQTMDSVMANYHIRKGNKQKNIAGYSCQQYIAEDDEHDYDIYVTPELKNIWKETYGSFMQRFTSLDYQNEFNKVEGMVMESTTTAKKNKKDVNTFRVTKVNHQDTKIQKSDYSFPAQ
ncbi:MAG: hypothetical protein R2806_06045 [Saprospiraceae bacterium]